MDSTDTRPWHPCDDGIDLLAKALEEFTDASVVGIRERLCIPSECPSRILTRELWQPGMGARTRSAGRQEMVRRWLQFNGFGDDATEVDQSLKDIPERLRQWEEEAREDVPDPDSIRVFSDEMCDRYDVIVAEAADTADYLRQLAAMVRAKLKDKAEAAGRQQYLAEDFTPPLPKAEIKRVLRLVDNRLWQQWLKERQGALAPASGGTVTRARFLKVNLASPELPDNERALLTGLQEKRSGLGEQEK